jgi:hypothetical protein
MDPEPVESPMKIPHLCGPDEVLQLDSRRPAMYHVPDVIEWAFDPKAEPGVIVVRWIWAAVNFVVGFVGGEWPTSWSSTQAEWGAQRIVHKATSWTTSSVATAVTTVGSIVTGYLGEPTLAGTVTGGEWLARGIRDLSKSRMDGLYPVVVAEWSAEVFGNLGVCCRLLLTLCCFGSAGRSEFEIE